MGNNKERQKLLTEFVKASSRRNRALWGNLEEVLGQDITNAQREALIAINEIPNCHISDIAKWLGVTNGAVTQLVDGLEKRGIVRRQADSQDARKVSVIITSNGMKEFKNATEHYVSKFSNMFEDLSIDQLRTLIDIQNVILSHEEK